MKNRKYYEQLYTDNPTVVTLIQFRQMLGGIGDTTARKLMRENRVKHYYIRHTYLIPKDWVIDYVLSEHYAEYREGLHQTAGRPLQGGEVVVQLLQQFHRQRIGKQMGKTPGTQRPGVQGDHQRLLYSVLLNVVFH